MSKKAFQGPLAYELARRGEKDLKFTGTMLAEVSEKRGMFEERSARIYRTVGGSYVAELVERSGIGADESLMGRAAQCADADGILEYFTVVPDPKKPGRRELLDVGKAALAKAGAVDESLRDTHVETID
ncbi:MAG: hypothetical protein JWM87_3957 [Candidatus Eremiobacteraeota bacterium]|nr:hypothetical protein [Candidatus Eremiobacteraeota bacterium]